MSDKHLVQILLPLLDAKRLESANLYLRIEEELTAKFDGLTAYTRTPAVGLWRGNGNATEKDDIVILEVMTEELDERWWQSYKAGLEETFSQTEIVIRVQSIRLL